MISFSVRAWSAWAPGIQSSDEWSRWSHSPLAPGRVGAPELKFIPAMVRRRFSRLSKMAMQVAFDATPPELLADVCSVFASRHGEANAAVALLSDIARKIAISPTSFSHAVHNTQGGLFSIAAGNGRTSSSIAAMENTFCAGLVEALGICERGGQRPTLLVVADEEPPEMIAESPDELPCAYALALLLDAGEPTGPATFRLTIEDAVAMPPVSAPRLPQALEFLAWMLTGEPTLRLSGGRLSWQFERAAS